MYRSTALPTVAMTRRRMKMMMMTTSEQTNCKRPLSSRKTGGTWRLALRWHYHNYNTPTTATETTSLRSNSTLRRRLRQYCVGDVRAFGAAPQPSLVNVDVGVNATMEETSPVVRATVCILGPPNAGKSTLFNRLLCPSENKTYRLAVDKGQRRGRGGTSRLSSRNLTKKRNRSKALAGGSSRSPKRRADEASGGAIVSATAGTTRDRRECVGRIGADTTFVLFDTAGVEGALTTQQLLLKDDEEDTDTSLSSKALRKKMMQQTIQAASQSDLILLMFDAKTAGITADLLETCRWLRRMRQDTDKHKQNHHSTVFQPRVLVVANKLEGNRWQYTDSVVQQNVVDAEQRLGFGEPLCLSALHGEGLGELAVEIQKVAQERSLQHVQHMRDRQAQALANANAKAAIAKNTGDTDSDSPTTSSTEMTNPPPRKYTNPKPLQLAILGRQNVGKSTLVNALLGQERVLCGSTPGLTRDAIAVDWMWQNQYPVKLVDTAGLRKRASRDLTNTIEDAAVDDALRALKVADVAVLVLDAGAKQLRKQELTIADCVLQEGRALVVVANKMDLVVEPGYTKEDFEAGVREQLEGRMPFLRQTPIVALSALRNEATEELLPVVFDARERWERTITTGKLNRWLHEVLLEQAPPMVSGRPVKLKYIVQTKGRPPTFLIFGNTETVPDPYIQYLSRHFQKSFGMYGMQVRISIKKSAKVNPYDPPNKRKRVGSGLGGREARKKKNLKELQKKYGGRTKEENRILVKQKLMKQKLVKQKRR